VKRGRRILVLGSVGCVVAGVAAAMAWPREKEPEYKGKKLREWVLAYSGASTSGRFLPKRYGVYDTSQGSEAIQQIGTNALPFLVRWIRHEPGSATDGILASIPVVARVSRGTRLTKERLAFGSILAFKELGTNATPAVAELEQMASDVRHPIARGRATEVLQSVRREAIRETLKR
jgi:hypothetical protein